MPKKLKNKKTYKKQISKKCKKECNTNSLKLSKKDRSAYMNLCLQACGLDKIITLKSKEAIKEGIKKIPPDKIQLIKKAINKLTINKQALDLHFDIIFKKFKDNFISILYEIKNDKDYLK